MRARRLQYRACGLDILSHGLFLKRHFGSFHHEDSKNTKIHVIGRWKQPKLSDLLNFVRFVSFVVRIPDRFRKRPPVAQVFSRGGHIAIRTCAPAPMRF